MLRIAALPPAIRPDRLIPGGCRRVSGRGFTLLEMLVVLAITGLIAALLFPQIGTARLAVRDRTLREALAAGAEGARAMALRSGAPATLSAGDGGTALLITGASTRRIALDATGSMRLAVRPPGIVFHPDGSTTGGELALGSGRNAARFLVDPANGQLRAAARASGNGG